VEKKKRSGKKNLFSPNLGSNFLMLRAWNAPLFIEDER
jgi:hypothetical protein